MHCPKTFKIVACTAENRNIRKLVGPSMISSVIFCHLSSIKKMKIITIYHVLFIVFEERKREKLGLEDIMIEKEDGLIYLLKKEGLYRVYSVYCLHIQE